MAFWGFGYHEATLLHSATKLAVVRTKWASLALLADLDLPQPCVK